MADLHDVENVLVSLIASIVYPSGTASASIAGTLVKIKRGWTVGAELDSDLAAKKINITVYPTDTEKRTTRYAPEWITLNVPTPSIAITTAANSISITGTPAPLQNTCAVVNGIAYIYPVQVSDTLASIATGLATLINAGEYATSSGSTITIPAAYSLAGRVGTVGTSIMEIRRQKRNFQISFWCPDFSSRDLIAAAVDDALADIDFLTLPDGSSGRLLYERSHVSDDAQKVTLYRRDLFYSVEYATTRTKGAAQIIAPLVRPRDASGIVGKNTLSTEMPFSLLTESGELLLVDPAHQPTLTLESGAYMLMEDGSRLLLDPVLSHDSSLQQESGAFMLLESGARLIVDAAPQGPGDLALELGGLLLTEYGDTLAMEDMAIRPAVLTESGGKMLTEYSYQFAL